LDNKGQELASITGNNLPSSQISAHCYHYMGQFECADASEKVATYKFEVYDSKSGLIKTTGELVHDSSQDVGNISVDTFDFAMRRRFRFIEIKVDENLEMLDDLNNDDKKNEAISRMEALNKEIAAVDDLNENYQIGAAYFLKLKHLSFDQLWTDYLEPLLWEYVNGMYDDKAIMQRFAEAYGYGARGADNDKSAEN
jgi:hypothetical protein